MKALTISKYLLSKINYEIFEELGEGLTNLKLQKLLFYIQKTYYSLYQKQLFSDDIKAWQYGPVVPNVYHIFKKYKNANIDIIDLKDEIKQRETVSAEILWIIDFVWDTYSKYSPWALVEMTQNDKAWKNNYYPTLNNQISVEDLYDETIKNEFLNYKKEIQNLSKIKIKL